MRIYIIPKTKADGRDKFGPKYLGWFGNPTTLPSCAGIRWEAKSPGELRMVLVSVDASSSQHQDIAAQSDVLVANISLDDNLSVAASNRIRSVLEAHDIPAHWVSTSITYRTALRVLRGIFAIISRCGGLGVTGVLDGVSLDDPVSSLAIGKRQAIMQAAHDMGIDTSALQLSMTIREALRILASQFGSFTIMGTEI